MQVFCADFVKKMTFCKTAIQTKIVWKKCKSATIQISGFLYIITKAVSLPACF